MCQFFGHQLVANHRVNVAGTLHQSTSLHRENAACNTTGLTLPTTQPPVNTCQHTTSAPSVFRLPSRYTGPCCSFTQANWSLALSNQHYSWTITAPSTQRHSVFVPCCKRIMSRLHQVQFHLISVWPFSRPHILAKELPLTFALPSP